MREPRLVAALEGDRHHPLAPLRTPAVPALVVANPGVPEAELDPNGGVDGRSGRDVQPYAYHQRLGAALSQAEARVPDHVARPPSIHATHFGPADGAQPHSGPADPSTRRRSPPSPAKIVRRIRSPSARHEQRLSLAAAIRPPRPDSSPARTDSTLPRLAPSPLEVVRLHLGASGDWLVARAISADPTGSPAGSGTAARVGGSRSSSRWDPGFVGFGLGDPLELGDSSARARARRLVSGSASRPTSRAPRRGAESPRPRARRRTPTPGADDARGSATRLPRPLGSSRRGRVATGAFEEVLKLSVGATDRSASDRTRSSARFPSEGPRGS